MDGGRLHCASSVALPVCAACAEHQTLPTLDASLLCMYASMLSAIVDLAEAQLCLIHSLRSISKGFDLT